MRLDMMDIRQQLQLPYPGSAQDESACMQHVLVCQISVLSALFPVLARVFCSYSRCERNASLAS